MNADGATSDPDESRRDHGAEHEGGRQAGELE